MAGRKFQSIPPTQGLGQAWEVSMACGLIVFAAVIAYWNSFSGPFVFDDFSSIPDNRTIRSLWPISGPLDAWFGDGRTVEGRPLLNLSFAINYAFGGTRLWGYHFGNLLIHILSGLALFGILRRTFLTPVMRAVIGESAVWLAGATAILWTVHPLQTEAVTYLVQRAESLASLFYLLTVYAFIRGADSTRGRIWEGAWFGASVLACLAGMATKEILVTAPVMVLLYDRTFVAGTFREALRRRWRVHAALMATWVFLAWLMIHGGSRGGTAGFGTTMSPWFYALTQCRAVLHYFQLVIWPDPLVFDYGYRLITNPWLVLPHALALVALGVLTLVALRCWPVVGFALCWVFVILAPTSTFVPSTMQVVAERRMYLPLVGLLALAVVGIYRLAGKRSVYVYVALAAEFTIFTVLRNHDYRTEKSIWADTVSKWPDNARAQNSLGAALIDEGAYEEAREHLATAVRLDPANAFYHNNLGNAYLHLRDADQAIAEFQEALREMPNSADAHCDLGNVYLVTGRLDEAVAEFQRSLALDPRHAKAHSNYGIALMHQGRAEEGIGQFRQAVEDDPAYAEGHNNLGLALGRTGHRDEAVAEFQEALKLDPQYTQARTNLNRLTAPPP